MTRAALLLSLLFCLGPSGFAHADEIFFDFRGKKMDEDLFAFAPNPGVVGQYMQFEEEGLRISWKADNRPRDAIGLVWNLRAHGDFETVVHFEILEADPTPYGTGVELYLMQDNETRDGLPLTKLRSSRDGGYSWLVQQRTGPNNNRKTEDFKGKIADQEQKRGRLKLQRKGDLVAASFAEGDEGMFEILNTFNIPNDIDFRMVRFGGLASGNQPAALDMRIFDVQFKGDLGGLQSRPAGVVKGPDGVPLPAASSPRAALWVVIILGMFSLAIFLGIFTFMRRKKAPLDVSEESSISQDKSAVENPSGQQEEANLPGPAAPKTNGDENHIRLACAACGKKIKINKQYAGKRIKCPQCGAAMRVPS